jgi:hypothetical protein
MVACYRTSRTSWGASRWTSRASSGSARRQPLRQRRKSFLLYVYLSPLKVSNLCRKPQTVSGTWRLSMLLWQVNGLHILSQQFVPCNPRNVPFDVASGNKFTDLIIACKIVFSGFFQAFPSEFFSLACPCCYREYRRRYICGKRSSFFRVDSSMFGLENHPAFMSFDSHSRLQTHGNQGTFKRKEAEFQGIR